MLSGAGAGSSFTTFFSQGIQTPPNESLHGYPITENSVGFEAGLQKIRGHLTDRESQKYCRKNLQLFSGFIERPKAMQPQ
jgi:hypothetical protein